MEVNKMFEFLLVLCLILFILFVLCLLLSVLQKLSGDLPSTSWLKVATVTPFKMALSAIGSKVIDFVSFVKSPLAYTKRVFTSSK